MFSANVFTQFNIGTNESNDKVVLQIVSGDSTQTMIIPVTNDTDRPAAEASLLGSLVYNTTDSSVQFCTGTQWLELSQSSGGGSNLYSTNGTLAGARTITMNGNDLTFDGFGDVIIKDNGNVGIGTTVPQVKLHISDSNANSQIRVENIGGAAQLYPSVQVRNYGSSDGFPHFQLINAGGTKSSPTALPANDEVGVHVFSAHDGSSFKQVANVKVFTDPTFSSTDLGTRISFMTASGTTQAYDNPERLTIASSGNVGIGTTSPSTKLEIVWNFNACDTCFSGRRCTSYFNS